MKKISFLPIFAVLLTLTACQDDFMPSSGLRGQGITGTIANEEGTATRAVMIDAPTQSVNLKWTAGDAIGVFDAVNSNLRYEAAAGDISADSTQAVFRAGGAVPQAEFLAYYPYSSLSSGSATQLQLTVSDRQRYVTRNFKPEPDPQACVMVGRGYANTVDFRNIGAILKVSYVPRDSDVVTSVVFSDLSGQPVSGPVTVTMAGDGTPQATYPATGEGQTIVLDCGAGVAVAPTAVSSFFLVVPARNYSKGFQLDFLLASGKTDRRTIGRRAGKTLQRSMVYGVGDVSAITKNDYTVVFSEGGGVIMDDDLMAMVKAIVPQGTMSAEGGYGNYYDLIVKPGTGLQEGMTVVINRTSEALPYGLTAKVVAISDIGGSQQVRLLQYQHAEQAYKRLLIGPQDVLNADGTPDEEKMLPLDLTGHFSHFVPAEGMEGVTVEMTDQGLVLTDNTWQGAPALTRASVGGKLKFPDISVNLRSTNNDRIGVGLAPAIAARIGASVTDMHLDYVAFTLTPTMTFNIHIDANYELASFIDKEIVIGRQYFTPVTVGPVVLIPEFKLSAYVSMKGQVKLQTAWSYTMGYTVGASYQDALGGGVKGWLFRCKDASSDNMKAPSLTSLIMPTEVTASASLDTQMGLVTDVGLSFYGIIDFTLFAKVGMELSAYMKLSNFRSNMGLSLTPVLEAGAAVGVLGLNPSRKVLLQGNFSPWWQRELYPGLRWIAAMDMEGQSPSNRYYPAFPAKEVKSIPLQAEIGGALLYDCEISVNIFKRENNSSAETLIHSIPIPDIYPASKLLYDEELKNANSGKGTMKISVELPTSLFADYDCVYTAHVYVKSKDATLGQKIPIDHSRYGQVDIVRIKDVWRTFENQKEEYFLVSDDHYETTVDDNDQIKTKRRY